MAKRVNGTWSALNAEDNKLWDDMFDRYVPDCGKAATVGGEIIRAMTRIIYRFFNDGDMVNFEYGIETVSSSFDYLFPKVPGLKLLDGERMGDDKYEDLMLDDQIIVFNYLKNNPSLFTEPNTEDSRDSTGYVWNDECEDDEWDYEEEDRR